MTISRTYDIIIVKGGDIMETKVILKKLRKDKGYKTMQDFCNAASISFSTYQNYETGKRLPTAEILMQLADFYHVSTDYLLGRTTVKAMNTLPDDALTEEQVKMIDEAIVDSYEKLSVETRRAFIGMLEDLFGNIFERDDFEVDVKKQTGT